MSITDTGCDDNWYVLIIGSLRYYVATSTLSPTYHPQVGEQTRTNNTVQYRRNWLLSACAYSNGQQETMRLTASVRLIERTWALRAGPSTACVTSVKDRESREPC